MSTGIPGILKKSGNQVVHDLILSGHDVDLDLNQVTIERVNTITYTEREATFAIKAREMGADGSRPIYGGQTSVVYKRFTADNYFSKFPWYIELEAPFTMARVLAALNAQTEMHWDLEDFKDVADYVVAVNGNGVATLPGSLYSKRLYLEINNSRLTVIITPPGRLNIARVLPPAAIQPPEEFFINSDRRTNLALRLPDANGVAVGSALVALVTDQIFDTEDLDTHWMTTVYGMADGFDVKWICKDALLDFNLFGSVVRYNGPLTEDVPAPYNTRLDRVLVFSLSPDHCKNYYGNGLIYYNLSRDGGN